MAVEHDTERDADRRVAADRSYGMFAGVFGDRCLSDELIAERRDEARRESAAESTADTR